MNLIWKSSVLKRCHALLFFLLIGVMVTIIFSFLSNENKSTHSTPQSSKNRALARRLDLPLYFEKNEGQINAQVKFMTRNQGNQFYFSPEEVSMFFQAKEKKKGLDFLKVQFIGVNPTTTISGVDEIEGKSNYFIGNNPTHWHTAISNYAKISYDNLYSGIDVIFYGNAKQLEYDFYVKPGSNPHAIRMHFEGGKELTIDHAGNLNIKINDEHTVQMKKPFIYQVFEGNKKEISGKFVLLAKQDIGFALDHYDAHQELIIDPILTYSTYLGGIVDNYGAAIAIDSSGNAYITGNTNSASFPTTDNAYQRTYGGGDSDVFITKLNSVGSSLLYSTYLGGTDIDLGNAIAVDSSGRAYITGQTYSTDFPTISGAYQSSLVGGVGNSNAFITILNSTGEGLVYSSYLGGGGDFGNGIAIDSSGNAYITGATTSGNFPTTAGAYQTGLAGYENAFITKVTPSQTPLAYSSYLGGENDDIANAIAVDSSGNAYLTGTTDSSEFPTTAGAYQTALMGGVRNAFITKLNPSGTLLDYSTYLGGSEEYGRGIVVDSSGNTYITGSTNSPYFPTTAGAYQTALNGIYYNAFITKLNPSGTLLDYSTYLGGSLNNVGNGIAVDINGNAYITGSTESLDFPTAVGAYQTGLEGSKNAFITKLNSLGSELTYSSYFGGGNADSGNGIALDISGNAYLTGETTSPNFPTTEGVFQTGLVGITNAFIAEFAIGTPTVIEVSPNSGPISGGTSVIITGTNFTYATAVYFGETLATSFIINSDTQITATSPAHVTGTLDITVEAIGVSSISSADQFTYILITPTVTNVSPNVGSTNGGTSVIITGTDFTYVTAVYFGGAHAIDFVINSDTQITATSPPHVTGTVNITVEATNISSISFSDQFTYQLNLTKTTLQISPNPTIAGQEVTLTASLNSNQATGTISFFDGVKLIAVKAVSDGQASFNVSSLSSGTHSIIASYSGDNQYLGSVSTIIKLVVKPRNGS